MPEQNPKFLDAYELTAADLQAQADAITASEDHIVYDAIVRGRRYIGFEVTNPSLTTVKVASGRFYNVDGARYFRDEAAAAVVLDLSDHRPKLQPRVVAIVAYQDEQDGAILYRYHETDAETGTKVPEQVVYTRLRKAKIVAVPGLESANPQPPGGLENAIVLATLTMTVAGIAEGSIIRNVDGQLPNLCDLADAVDLLDERMDRVEPLVATISSDLAKLQAQASGAADRALLYSAVDQLAIVQRKLDIPATYGMFRADDFVDASDCATAAIGYAARADQGLRLPFAASDITQLSLFNSFDPNAMVSAQGLLLPKYNWVERRIVKGNAGTLSLAQYTMEDRTLQRVTLGRTRTRFGGDFEASAGSSFFVGAVIASGVDQLRFNFVKNGENYQASDTGRRDSSGQKIYRVAQFWVESTPTYWSPSSLAPDVIRGYARVETFLNTQDGWCLGLGPDIVGKPASGSITVGLCGTYRGEPDFDNIIAMATLEADKINLAVQSPSNYTYFNIEPTFLEGGKRYGLFFITAADYTVAVGNADQGAGGTLFYGTNGGIWNADTGAHIMFRLKMATFPQTNVDIEFKALSLGGGIQMIDVLADGIIPGQTDLAYGVNLGGATPWTKLDGSERGLLDTLPVVLKFRGSFVGTSDVMPALRLPGSEVRFSRLAPAGKLIKPQRTVPSTTRVTLKGRIKPGFDPAHQTYVPSLLKADGTKKVADAIQTTTEPDGTTVKVATFDFTGAPITQYSPVVDYGTDAIQRPLVGGTLTEIAA